MIVSGLLAPDIIRRIAEANPIEQVIGADVPLKKAGAAVLVGLCPFHQEKSPSLTVTPARQRHKCFGCGAGGDVFGYVMARNGVGFRDAVLILAQRAGITVEGDGQPAKFPANLRSRPKLVAVPVQSRPLRLPTDLRSPTRAELRVVAARRGLSVAGVELASERGLLWFGSPKGLPAWIVTDSERVNVQARRLDGRLWSHIGGKKAFTLPGARAGWPIGTREAAAAPFVVLVEGGPDLLAAHHFIFVEGRERDVAAVAMLGAYSRIPSDALALFKGQRVRLYPHADAMGHDSARRWAEQLEAGGCEVDAFRFEGLSRFDGEPVKDLNDLALLDADDFEREAKELGEVLPR